LIDALRGAFAFLTIVPLAHSAGKPGHIFAYFPLVGLLIGALLVLVASNRLFSADLTAFLVLLVWIVITGGLHLDGLADSCDGLFATAAPERRLEIMKDPRAGSWAVIGVVTLLLGKWLALREIQPIMLLVPPVIGRWAMVIAAWGFPYARPSGMGSYFRYGLGRAQVVIASITALTVIPLLIRFEEPAILLAFLLVPVIVVISARWADGRLGGGLTGDVYGALCEGTELLCLLILSIH
jgi:adenosylcobinamide-GDP ribazoletransferase